MNEGNNREREATIAQLRATIASVEEQWHADSDDAAGDLAGRQPVHRDSGQKPGVPTPVSGVGSVRVEHVTREATGRESHDGERADLTTQRTDLYGSVSSRKVGGTRKQCTPTDDTQIGSLATPVIGGSDQISDLGQAKKIALRYMSTRPRSVWEVWQELRRRQVIDQLCDQVIERFTQVSLLDDRSFAQQWVSTRRGSKSLSLSRLKHELTAKGIAAEVIAEALDGAEESEADLAVALARKRVASMRGQDQATLVRRLSSQLERRGFAPGVVRSAVIQVVDETLGDRRAAQLGNIADDE